MRIFGSVRRLLAIGLVVLYASFAQAAGEWEWTADQGWMRGAGVSRGTPKEQLNYAYSLEQRGEFMDASRNYFLLIQNFPDSQEAGVGLQRLARCLYEMENYYTSYKAIEQVIETYPNTGRMSDLVEIELRIAKKMMVSETPDILSDRTGNARDFNIRRALEIINSVIEHDPYGPVAAEAYLVKGEGLLFINDVNGARAAFETIRDEFPRSDYLERAKLGLLTCDSLMGQATPQEWQEQAAVVREAERDRGDAARDSVDELDDVEGSIRQLAEIEAAKMMDQAEQYRRMGTRQSVESSKFLYNEVIRRYPGTPQAEDAMDKLGTVKTPREAGRIAKTLKNININPFTFNRDPEPPWIVPQMDPEDMVMVDSGLGPIAGVPETGAPATSGAAGVRPAALREDNAAPDAREDAANFSPIAAAPSFIDGVRPPASTNAPGGLPAAPMPPSFSGELASPNPLPSISESDLIGDAPGAAALGFGSPPAPTQSLGGFVPPPAGTGFPAAPVPAPSPSAAVPAEPPSLGTQYHTPYSDLIGPAPRTHQTFQDSGYGTAYDVYTPQAYYSPAPVPTPQPYAAPTQPQYYQPEPYYQQPQAVPQQPAYADPYSAGSLAPPAFSGGQGGGGWTMGEDFR